MEPRMKLSDRNCCKNGSQSWGEAASKPLTGFPRWGKCMSADGAPPFLDPTPPSTASRRSHRLPPHGKTQSFLTAGLLFLHTGSVLLQPDFLANSSMSLKT